MNSVGSFAAKTHLSDLLVRVERGESFVITKRGRAVARLSPILPPAQSPGDMIAAFRRRHGSRLGGITPSEIRAWKSKGRR